MRVWHTGHSCLVSHFFSGRELNGLIGTLAGLIGFSINNGGGLSSLIVGGILDRLNWDAVFYALAFSALRALSLVALAAPGDCNHSVSPDHTRFYIQAHRPIPTGKL